MDEFDEDFRDLIGLFNSQGVDFLVVGAHCLAVHDVPRTTGDIDFWVRPTPENAERVFRSLASFGVPLADATAADFARIGFGFHVGAPPGRIDVLTAVTGLAFDEAWENRFASRLYDQPVFALGRDDLIRNKLAAGRDKDLLDVKNLRSHEPPAR